MPILATPPTIDVFSAVADETHLGPGIVAPLLNAHSNAITGTQIKMLGYQNKYMNVTAPFLSSRVLTYPQVTTNNDITTSLVGGALRFSPTSPIDGNFRKGFGWAPGGVSAAAEVRSTISAMNITPSVWDTAGRIQVGHIHRMTSTEQRLDYGVAAAGSTSTTMVVAGTPWTTNQFMGTAVQGQVAYVYLTTGANAAERKRIISNTSNTLTLESAWTNTPAAGQPYFIVLQWVRALVVMNSIVFANPSQWQLNTFNGNAFESAPAGLDFGAYLRPGGVLRPLPWHVKSYAHEGVVDLAIWQGLDPEPGYGTVGQSGTFTIPTNLQTANQTGECGIVMGHFNAGDYVELSDFAVSLA